MDAMERNKYELIPHPAYSPDLAPRDFFLFPNLKKDNCGRHFLSDEEVATAVEEWANGKDPDFFGSGLTRFDYSLEVLALELQIFFSLSYDGENVVLGIATSFCVACIAWQTHRDHVVCLRQCHTFYSAE